MLIQVQACLRGSESHCVDSHFLPVKYACHILTPPQLSINFCSCSTFPQLSSQVCRSKVISNKEELKRSG